MKKLIFFILIISVPIFAKDVYVNGYYNKSGKYVEQHYRSGSNYSKSDNWTTNGNVNPYTKEKGTKTYKNSFNYKKYGKK